MPIYSPTGFLDITNATLRTSNLEAQNFKLNGGNIYVTSELTTDELLNLDNVVNAGNATSNTVQFTNVTTGLVADSNIVVTGNVTAGSFLGDGSGLTSIPPSAITGTLSQWSDGTNGDVYIASNVGIGNVHTLTSNTLQVGANLYVRDADANVLTVTGNVAADYFEGDGSKLTGISSTLQAITDSGNVTSNTVQFSNATTGFVTTSNIEVGGALKINTITAAAYHSLQAVTNVGNVTSNTVQFSNATTGLVTTGNVEVGRDLSVTGNLTVLGTRTIVDTDTLRVKDPIIELGKDNPGTGDLGLVMTRPSGSSNVAVVFDESEGTLEIGYTQSNASDTTITMRTAATEPLDVNVNGNVTITKNLEYGISPDRIQQHVTGGGKVFFGNPIQGSTPDYYFGNTITLDGTESTPTGPPDYLKWDQRVIPINFDLDNMYTTSGYVNITCPTSGTIDFINSLGTIQALTCTENGIPFDRGVWLALYYRWNPSGVEGTTMAVSGNDRGLVLVDYRYLPMNRTSKWILLAIVNSDVNSCKWLPGCTHIPRNMTYSASHPLLTYPYVFKNCVEISGAALGAGWYWFKDHNMTKPEYTYFDTVGWALAFSSKTYGNASFDLLNKGVGWNYLRVQSKDGTHMNRVWFASKQDYATRSSTSTSSTKSLYISGMRVYLGSAGGHGIYNTSQSVCNWSTAANAIGAGYDGSNCGSYPNNLVWGTGVGNSPSYTNITSGEVWEIWIYFE